MGSISTNRMEWSLASAIRLTSTAPRYTAIGGIVALTMPRSEYLISELGDAAHASAIPWRRFFRTRWARPFVLEGRGWCIQWRTGVPGSVPPVYKEWSGIRDPGSEELEAWSF